MICVEKVSDDGSTPLRQLQSDATKWKLVKTFLDVRDACRHALTVRDAGKHTTGERPVVRVRHDGETVLIMQRLRYRDE